MHFGELFELVGVIFIDHTDQALLTSIFERIEPPQVSEPEVVLYLIKVDVVGDLAGIRKLNYPPDPFGLEHWVSQANLVLIAYLVAPPVCRLVHEDPFVAGDFFIIDLDDPLDYWDCDGDLTGVKVQLLPVGESITITRTE